MTWRDRRSRQSEQHSERAGGELEQGRTDEASEPRYQLDEDALFGFLEESLIGFRRAECAPGGLLLFRALELANDEWTEAEAAQELIHVSRGDRRALEGVHRRLQCGLLRNPLVDVPGIRASRIAREALHRLT